MTVVDANVMIYAVNADDVHHEDARPWLEAALRGTETVGFAWVAMLAFLRVGTHPRLFPSPLTVDEAVRCLDDWLAQPAAAIVGPSPRHLAVMSGLLTPTGTAGNLVVDAHLAALALEHRARVASFDRDFLRFPGVQLTVPGQPAT